MCGIHTGAIHGAKALEWEQLEKGAPRWSEVSEGTQGHPSGWEGRAAARLCPGSQTPIPSLSLLSVPASFRLSSCEGWAELSVWPREEQKTNDPAGKSLVCYKTSPGKAARGGGVTHKPSWHTQSSTFSVLKPQQPRGVMQEGAGSPSSAGSGALVTPSHAGGSGAQQDPAGSGRAGLMFNA